MLSSAIEYPNFSIAIFIAATNWYMVKILRSMSISIAAIAIAQFLSLSR